MQVERRRAPRAQILGRLHGRVVTLDTEIEIREIGLGGMSILSDVLFPVGAVHQFNLVLGDGARVPVVAEARHSRPVEAGARPKYLTGFQFIDDEPAPDGDAVGAIVDSLR